jgi:hypothetical protein
MRQILELRTQSVKMFVSVGEVTHGPLEFRSVYVSKTGLRRFSAHGGALAAGTYCLLSNVALTPFDTLNGHGQYAVRTQSQSPTFGLMKFTTYIKYTIIRDPKCNGAVVLIYWQKARMGNQLDIQ